MLRLTSIPEHFGGLSVLQDVNTEMPRDSAFGLIGPDDVDKTTAFSLITGLPALTGGSLMLNGDDPVGKKPHQITQMGIARTFQNIHIFKGMTPLENVMVGMHRHLDYGAPGLLLSLPKYRATGYRTRDHALEPLSWIKPNHEACDIANSLLYGDQRKLELARASVIESKLLLLDGPVTGMNIGGKIDLVAGIENIEARSYTILMIEHDVRFVMGLCERIAVLNSGRIIAEGLPETIRNDP